MGLQELVEAVEAEALARYSEGGWDVLVECWTAEEYDSYWRELPKYPATAEEAIASVGGLVSVWADRQADARNSAF